MGKPTGFIEYERQGNEETGAKERIRNFNEFHLPMSRSGGHRRRGVWTAVFRSVSPV